MGSTKTIEYAFLQGKTSLTLPTGNLQKNETKIKLLVQTDTETNLVNTQQRIREQTSEEEIDILAEKLDVLKENLNFLRGDDNGVERLLNTSGVINKWKEYYPNLKEDYKENKELTAGIEMINSRANASFFQKTIAESFPYSLLFYGINIHELLEKKEIVLTQYIYDFMAGISLPIDVTVTLDKEIENNETGQINYQVALKGELQEDEETQEKLTAQITTLLGRVNVATEPTTNYIGKMAFDEDGWPVDGGLFYTAGVQGLLQKECLLSFKRAS